MSPKNGSRCILEPAFMAFDVLRIPLTLSDYLVFSQELLGRYGKRLAVLQLTTLLLALEFKVPVLGKSFAWARPSSFVLIRRFRPPMNVEHCQKRLFSRL